MGKQMAIVIGVAWHPNDERSPGLFLNVEFGEGAGALLVVPREETWSFFNACGLISSEGLRFADLKGKPVWVENDGRMSRLLGPCVFPRVAV